VTTETAFVEALRDPGAARPDGLTDGLGRSAGRRFDVYRNNVTVSLIEALRTAFPVVETLLGEANFRILARAFAQAHPPSSPLMMFYGAEMPGFLAAYGPTSHTRYLPDVARLELALRESYHAADAAPVPSDKIAALPPETLIGARLQIAPSARLIRSDWPIHAIWRFNTEPGAPKPQMAAEDVLILRPEFDPAPHLLPPGGGAVVARIMDGASLGDALEDETTDLARILAILIGHGAITEVIT
jgi:hypothetical protein